MSSTDETVWAEELAKAFGEFKAAHRGEVDKLKAQVGTLQTSIDEANIALTAGSRGRGGDDASVNIRAALHDNPALQAMRDGNSRAAIIPIAGSIKAALTGDTGSEKYTVPPQYQPGLFGWGRRALGLLDLLPKIVVHGGSFQYNRVGSAFAHASAIQAKQGDAKASQTIPVDLVTANIATIAAIAAASEQVLSDEPTLAGRVQELLMYGARQKLEAELVAGTSGTGKITGLVASGTAFTAATGEAPIDRISECAASLASAGWNPSAIVMHPSDWHAIRTTKASTSGVYLAGTYAEPAQPSVWGLPVVQSAALTAGSAIVMDAQQVALLDRQQVVVDLGRMGDDFGNNIVRLRCELRAGLAVFAPSAVQIVDLTTA